MNDTQHNTHHGKIQNGSIFGAWKGLQGPYKTALIILLLAVLWMMSGIFNKTGNIVQDSAGVTQKLRVRVMTVKGEMYTPVLTVMGRVNADQSVNVRAQVLGHVLDVAVKKGDKVKAGDVILHIDPEDRKDRVQEAIARRKQREIAYQAARKLRKGGYSSQLKEAQAKADLEAARAQVTRMKKNLDNTKVKAPISGIMNTLPVKAGDYFDKIGGLVGRIVNLDTMVALGQVAERNIGKIALGKPAEVRLPDGRELKGEVTYIASASNALTRTFAVEVTLNLADDSVREGITAEINLPLLAVFAYHVTPALLTLDDSGKIGVKTVNADNIVEFDAVKIVSDTPTGMWVTGLPTRPRIISVGQEFVGVGQTVDVVKGELKSMIDQNKPSTNNQGN